MNIRDYINLFEEIPDIVMKCESTCPPAYVHTLSMHEEHLCKCANMHIFSGNNIISRIKIQPNGVLVLYVESFHEENRPVTLYDVLKAMVNAAPTIIFHISNYDMDLKSRTGNIPKFFESHPEYLNRDVMGLSYEVKSPTEVDVFIRLDHDIDRIFQIEV